MAITMTKQKPKNFNNKKKSITPQIPLILKDKTIINNNYILNIIDKMVTHKLNMDKLSRDSYAYHHVACFWYGISCRRFNNDIW